MIKHEAQVLPFLKDGGEMGELIRTKDWRATPLGSPDSWSQSLRTSVSILLHSKFPMFVWWGPELTTIYNDAYRIIAGDKHPQALGESGPKVWSEIWDVVGPLAEQVMREGSSTWAEDQLLYINRRGHIEESYFTFSYSPVLNELGEVAGVFCACTETTEKVFSQQRITESEKNLRSTILQAPVAMCILRGPQFVVEIANDRMFELWGRSKEELLHKSIFDGLPEVRDQGYEDLLTGVYTTGQSFSANGTPVSLPRNGTVETVYINLLYEPFREGNGTVSGVIAVATDITEQILIRKKLEEAEAELQQRVDERTADLAQQKAFIGSILNASLNGIYAVKAVRNQKGEINDFSYLFANDNIAKLVNVRPDEIIGKSVLQLLPENKTNGFFDLFCRVLQSGETVHDVTHFTTQNIDGWFDYVIVPVDKETLVVTIQDISENKRTSLQIEEQRNLLDSILKHSSNGISVSQVFRDENDTVVDALTILANDAAVRYIGLPKEIYLTKRATEIEPNIIGSAYYQQCIKTLETGEPFVAQYQMESTGRWLELTVSKLDKNHLIHVFSDVTPMKEAQLQQEKLVEDLKRSNQNLEEFAYAASHDLQEPIRKIHLFSERLRDSFLGKIDAAQEMYFNRMSNAANRMSNLIDDLLVYSHVSRGVALEEMVNLNQKVALVLEDLEVEIEEKKAVIQVGPLPTVKGHRRQLQQVFHNLITNALKYHKAGVAPCIEISSRLVFGNDKEVPVGAVNGNEAYHLIQVKDNGIGFKPEDANRIFNVFTRLHGNAEYKGTGVGLSIVQRVVQNHHGSVWADSIPGEGARFKLLLPAS